MGIFGGTFDPVHFGHLRVAFELYQDLDLAEVRMIPARQPPHRGAPNASPEQRVALLKAALAGQSALRLDLREMDREGPSYTVDTLSSLRADLGDTPLCLIMGSDAFGSLGSWHRWEAIVENAHIIVAHRPGWHLDTDAGIGRRLRDRITNEPGALRAAPAGRVLPWQVTQLAISSTRIREMLAQGLSPRYLLPQGVLKLIESQKLYQH